MSKLSSVEGISDVSQDARDLYKDSLNSVGISSPVQQSRVFIGGIDGDVVSAIAFNVQANINVLILGPSGFGKTGIVKQVATKLGRELYTLTTSAKLPEDFGGRPLSDERVVSKDINRALVSKTLKDEKAREQASAEIAQREKESGETLSNFAKDYIIKKVANSITVTDDEIDAKMADDDTLSYKRLREVYAAPDWVYTIMDNYLVRGIKTIIFLDEVNHATNDVMNTLFQLVDVKMFADKKEYDMSDAVTFVAAGNFRSQNAGLTKLPEAFVRRFPFVIINPEDWGSAIIYLYHKYSQINTDIAKLIKDVGPVQWKTAFHDPAQLERTLQALLYTMDGGAPIENISFLVTPEGIPKQKITEFINKFRLSTSRNTTYSAQTSSMSTNSTLMRNIFDTWEKFKLTKVVRMPDGKGGFISDPSSANQATTFSWGRPGSKEAYKEILMNMPEYAGLPLDFWESLS